MKDTWDFDFLSLLLPPPSSPPFPSSAKVLPSFCVHSISSCPHMSLLVNVQNCLTSSSAASRWWIPFQQNQQQGISDKMAISKTQFRYSEKHGKPKITDYWNTAWNTRSTFPEFSKMQLWQAEWKPKKRCSSREQAYIAHSWKDSCTKERNRLSAFL